MISISFSRQKGLALISVLFITALVVAIITAISHRQTIDIQLTGNLVFRTQAFQYIKAVEIMAEELMYQDYDYAQQQNKKFVDHLNEKWSTDRLLYPIEGRQGFLEAEIFDLQGKYNLNNLVDKNYKIIPTQFDYLKRLFSQISSTHTTTIPSEIPESIVDWLDEDNSSTGLGLEEGDYLIKDPAYRTLNFLFSSIDELMLIDKMKDYFPLIAPHVSALPEQATLLNVNTMSREVILSLDPAITESDVDTLIKDRAGLNNGYEEVSDFLQHQAFAGISGKLNPNDFTVVSNYFLLKTRVTLGDRVVQSYSVLFRDSSNGKTQVISRDLSKRFIPNTNKPIFSFN
ncbi:type II secretion system minor pseudopilin GspK [Litoribrevibacter albus]|uniref:Type II secretion system protein K n=1 Tax=Litoribrevibacter albus TaxID=1473156 RepID=A0AA37SC24_9GAMM|nr:type II secretion system minor pseudopilin GspK [Litoribrevibacter albus]GLQ31836.1 hypothetical protein GCM10007876_23150 [Litoribrevibacter albus]